MDSIDELRMRRAAPAMLAALKHLCQAAENSDDACYGTLSTNFVRNVASAAIAAATEGAAPALTFGDAVAIAKGCMDYRGGYLNERVDIFRHGIETVVSALTAAGKRGLEDAQVRSLHAMGAAPAAPRDDAWNLAIEAAAQKAVSFLVGDPANGVPLRSPMGHEIAAAIRSIARPAAPLPEPVAWMLGDQEGATVLPEQAAEWREAGEVVCPLFDRPPPTDAWWALYRAINRVVAPLGFHGSISARDDRVSALMDALHVIDGGVPVASPAADDLVLENQRLVDLLARRAGATEGFRAFLWTEINKTINPWGESLARQEAGIDMADHLLVKFNALFPEDKPC